MGGGWTRAALCFFVVDNFGCMSALYEWQRCVGLGVGCLRRSRLVFAPWSHTLFQF